MEGSLGLGRQCILLLWPYRLPSKWLHEAPLLPIPGILLEYLEEVFAFFL